MQYPQPTLPEASLPPPQVDSRPKVSFWRKLGGGSLSISLIVHGIILAIGIVWVVSIIPPPPEKKVDFLPSGGGGGSPASSDVKNKKRSMSLQSNAPRMAAVGAESKFALPEPDTSSEMSSLGSLGGGGMSGGLGGSGSGGGKGDGQGKGFGSGMGPGLGGGTGGGVTFFNQQIKAQRIVYVIDYSLSMSGRREKLMRDELTKSVQALSPLTQFQLIFFSGPAWIAGDTVSSSGDHKSYTVTSGDQQFRWEYDARKGGLEPRGKRERAEWIRATRENLDIAGRNINQSKLSYGTDWFPPLEMALAMDPPPDVMFFMTDGSTDGDVMKNVRTVAAKAKVKNTVINTISMMEPAAIEGMRELAHRTGGKFSVIEQDGSVKVEPQ